MQNIQNNNEHCEIQNIVQDWVNQKYNMSLSIISSENLYPHKEYLERVQPEIEVIEDNGEMNSIVNHENLKNILSEDKSSEFYGPKRNSLIDDKIPNKSICHQRPDQKQKRNSSDFDLENKRNKPLNILKRPEINLRQRNNSNIEFNCTRTPQSSSVNTTKNYHKRSNNIGGTDSYVSNFDKLPPLPLTAGNKPMPAEYKDYVCEGSNKNSARGTHLKRSSIPIYPIKRSPNKKSPNNQSTEVSNNNNYNKGIHNNEIIRNKTEGTSAEKLMNATCQKKKPPLPNLMTPTEHNNKNLLNNLKKQNDFEKRQNYLTTKNSTRCNSPFDKSPNIRKKDNHIFLYDLKSDTKQNCLAGGSKRQLDEIQTEKKTKPNTVSHRPSSLNARPNQKEISIPQKNRKAIAVSKTPTKSAAMTEDLLNKNFKVKTLTNFYPHKTNTTDTKRPSNRTICNSNQKSMNQKISLFVSNYDGVIKEFDQNGKNCKKLKVFSNSSPTKIQNSNDYINSISLYNDILFTSNVSGNVKEYSILNRKLIKDHIAPPIENLAQRYFLIHRNEGFFITASQLEGGHGLSSLHTKQNKIIHYSFTFKKIKRVYDSNFHNLKLTYHKLACYEDNMFIALMEGYNPLMMGRREREYGCGYLIHASIKTGKILKFYQKITAEPINCISISAPDDLFIGSADGLMLNFSINEQILIKSFDENELSGQSIEAIFSYNNYLFVYDLECNLRQFSINQKILQVDWGCLHQNSLGATISCYQNFLWSSDRNGVVKKWNIQRHSLIKNYGEIFRKINLDGGLDKPPKACNNKTRHDLTSINSIIIFCHKNKKLL